MALIICPECCNKISELATICPKCGYPLANEDETIIKNPQIFTQNLDIGKKFINLKNNTAFKGVILHQNKHALANIPSGKVKIILHTNGIRIQKEEKTNYDIHSSQIISTNKYKTKETKITSNNRVIGTAIIMGLLGTIIGYYIVKFLGDNSTSIGWLINKEVFISSLDTYMMLRALLIILTSTLIGCIIGGLSGLELKYITKTTQYLIIKFWEEKYDHPQSITIECDDKQPISSFLKRQQQEHNIK